MQNILSVIGVPFESGCDHEGVGMAPDWLWRNGAFAQANSTPLWVNLHLPTNESSQYGVKNYETILKTCISLRETVSHEYQNGCNLCIIGGDHSIALGSVAGVLEHNPNVGVIWFDAHGDINTEATSPSANAHGMPVAALMGLCKSGINDIATNHLKPQNIFWVGARDLDPGEFETIKQLGILDNVYSTKRVHELGMEAVMEDIKRKMEKQGVETIHLSFDVDGMDPSIVWATGTRVENGLKPADLEAFIEELHKLPEMKSMDFVEYNPMLDDEEKTTGKWCVETLMRLVES